MANAPAKKPAAKPAAKPSAKTAAPAETKAAKPAAKATEKTTPARIGTQDLAKLVHAKVGVTALATVNAVVNATLATITEEFKKGNVIALKDFGKFELKDKPARKGRNPATGETIDIPAKIVPKFSFAPALKNG